MSILPETNPGLQRPGLFLKVLMWWGPRPLLQAAAILLLALLGYALISTVLANMARVGIAPGFSFLWRSANFEIGEQPIPFSAGDSYLRALVVGLLNTLKVAVLGCILATILGVFVGVAGLSSNPLLRGVVRVYIEVVRNTPLLLQLLLWIALAQALPSARQAISLFDAFYLSNRGVFLPKPVFEGASAATWFVLTSIVVAYIGLLVSGFRRNWLTAARAAGLTLGVIAIGGVALKLSGVTVGIETPALGGFNIRGGYSMTPEFAALLIGLVVKFSASIAEIVRAGILSVKQGQWEAGRALGLSNGQIMRLIVLPQALRVITPLTTSNYLDLTKDSSLAVAIGYPDLVNIVNTTANTTGQAFEALTVLVAVYLILNITVSVGMNYYNKRVALRGGKPA